MFHNSFSRLSSTLWTTVEPAPLSNPKLAAIVPDVAQSLGQNIAGLSNPELVNWLNGNTRLAGDQRIATCYAGHQFGVWAGQLGDGRALSLGELVSDSNERREVQVKGLGKTPYSRMGDGRAVIRSSVREFLCAEYLHALGVPSTRSLALLVSDTPVRRETLERGAVVARVFPSQVRFGHFEYLYHYDHHVLLPELVDYVRVNFMPGFPSTGEWFAEVVRRTARLIAHWQAVGFCHGVMNTDNMSILGLTLDYGPFGFLGNFDPGYVCNHSDHDGRYSYQNQPRIGLWNLQCLASCFLPTVSETDLMAALDQYEPELTKTYAALMARKIGVEFDSQTLTIVAPLLTALEKDGIDYHFFFACLSRYEQGHVDSLAKLWAEYAEAPNVRQWLTTYDAAIGGSAITNRTGIMQASNPCVVLHNHIAQQIIARVEQDDFSELQRLLSALQSPFAIHSTLVAAITPYRGATLSLSCSS